MYLIKYSELIPARHRASIAMPKDQEIPAGRPFHALPFVWHRFSRAPSPGQGASYQHHRLPIDDAMDKLKLDATGSDHRQRGDQYRGGICNEFHGDCSDHGDENSDNPRPRRAIAGSPPSQPPATNKVSPKSNVSSCSCVVSFSPRRRIASTLRSYREENSASRRVRPTGQLRLGGQHDFGGPHLLERFVTLPLI
jgi:hypothetical protein